MRHEFHSIDLSELIFLHTYLQLILHHFQVGTTCILPNVSENAALVSPPGLLCVAFVMLMYNSSSRFKVA